MSRVEHQAELRIILNKVDQYSGHDRPATEGEINAVSEALNYFWWDMRFYTLKEAKEELDRMLSQTEEQRLSLRHNYGQFKFEIVAVKFENCCTWVEL